MKLNKWTVALVATGVVSLASVKADEHPIGTALSSTTLSGYVDTSAIWNFGTGNGQVRRWVNTAPGHQDGFNLEAVKVALEKPLDEGTWSAGYKAELFYGAVNDVAAFRNYLKQAYVALRVPVGNGIDFKVGRFDPIVGYEVVDSYANNHYSRSLGFAIEPLIHTGVLATYQFNDIFGASAGVANSEFASFAGGGRGGARAESSKDFMAGIVLRAPDSTGWLAGSSLYAGVVDSAGRGRDTYNIYVGGTIGTPITGLTTGIAYDHTGGGQGNANAIALYLSYQLTEQVKLHGRAEYGNSRLGLFTGGGRDKVTALTGTVDYALWANVVSRAEFRWDHVAGGAGRLSGQKNDLSLTANLIYKF